MELGSIPPVHVDGSVMESFLFQATLVRQVVLEPAGQQMRHGGVVPGGLVDVKCPVVAGQQAQRVTVHKIDTFLRDILAGGVLLEGPQLQHMEDVGIGDKKPLAVCLLQDKLGHDLCLHPLSVHLDADASHLVRSEISPVHAEAVGNFKRLAPRDPLGMHLGKNLVRSIPRVVPFAVVRAHQLLPLWLTCGLQVPVLVVEEQVQVEGAKSKSLADGLGLRVLRVANEGLGGLELGVRGILDGRVVEPSQHLVVRLGLVGARHGANQ
mmetsp:Transcript_21162/g.68459  ORF Transcript_21162/g.68459 Transcript_21162/m.68459 type:complete len:266 (+) Transcript_21162:1800-2597(+)